MRHLRIGYDARYINDRYHGIGRYAFGLLEALTRLAPEHTFIVYKGKGNNSRFDWNLVSQRTNVVFRDGPWPLYWPQEQLVWPFAIRREKLDLFHSPYFVAPLFVETRLPILLTIHDLIFDRYPQFIPRSWLLPYYRILMCLGVRRASRLIVVSQATGQDLKKFYQVCENRLVTAPEGIDPGFGIPTSFDDLQAVRQQYKLSSPFILTVGARRPHKNLGRLVEAFSRIRNQVPHTLVFVGPADPRFKDEAQWAASRLGLNGRTRFLDWVPEAALPSLYCMADLVVLPSLIEGFGLPALEAMACGTAILAANTSSFPEVVGDAGMLVDPYNVNQMSISLLRILEDNSLRQKLSSAGQQRVSKFSWESTAGKIIETYHQVLP